MIDVAVISGSGFYDFPDLADTDKREISTKFGSVIVCTGQLDDRKVAFIARHGHECWEVDALDPATLQQLIRAEFEAVIDFDLLDGVKEQEKEDKRKLT